MLGLRRHVFPHTEHVDFGLFGIDEDGNHYFYDDLRLKINSGIITKDDIVALGFNCKELQAAGCGFAFRYSSMSYAWADESVAFNPNKLPYITSKSVALTTQMSGKRNTELIIEIYNAKECGTYTYNDTTGMYDASTDLKKVFPRAAMMCAAQSLTIGGVKRTGFLPSFAQLYHLLTYCTYNEINKFLNLLGRGTMNFSGAAWWLSCQYSSEKSAMWWARNYGTYPKTIKCYVVPCFDL